MNKVDSFARGEVARLAVVAILIPGLGLLVRLAHAYVHSSERYFLNNAAISQNFEPIPFAFLCAEAIITFLGSTDAQLKL